MFSGALRRARLMDETSKAVGLYALTCGNVLPSLTRSEVEKLFAGTENKSVDVGEGDRKEVLFIFFLKVKKRLVVDQHGVSVVEMSLVVMSVKFIFAVNFKIKQLWTIKKKRNRNDGSG